MAEPAGKRNARRRRTAGEIDQVQEACGCSTTHLIRMLLMSRISDRERLAIARRIIPDGYLISGPEREESILRMEALIDAYMVRPTQYGRDAIRPEIGG